MSAPKCRFSGCGNTTWNPEGYCHIHVGFTANDSGANGFGFQAPTNPSLGRTQEAIDQIVSDVENVFPDIDHPITPYAIRQQAIGVATAATSIEMYRVIPSVDGLEKTKRDEMLFQWNAHISNIMQPHPVHTDADEMIGISESSIDEYGRGLQESSDLVSYALIKEWEYARLTGQVADEYGYPYENTQEEFLTRVGPVITMYSSLEYFRQMHNYSSIVSEVSGGAPRTEPPSPDEIPRSRLDLYSSEDVASFIDSPLISPEEKEYGRQRLEHERQVAINQQNMQSRAEARKQAIGLVVGTIGAIAATKKGRTKPSQSYREQINAREQQKIKDQDAVIRRNAYRRAKSQSRWYDDFL